MSEQKMTPEQALSNVIGICTRYAGYAWGEQQVIVDSLRLLDTFIRENTPVKEQAATETEDKA